MTNGQKVALGLAVTAVLFGLGLAAGGSLGEVALVWGVLAALMFVLLLTRRR